MALLRYGRRIPPNVPLIHNRNATGRKYKSRAKDSGKFYRSAALNLPGATPNALTKARQK